MLIVSSKTKEGTRVYGINLWVPILLSNIFNIVGKTIDVLTGAIVKAKV
mgnify:CR=1 FL=1